MVVYPHPNEKEPKHNPQNDPHNVVIILRYRCGMPRGVAFGRPKKKFSGALFS